MITGKGKWVVVLILSSAAAAAVTLAYKALDDIGLFFEEPDF